MREVGIIPTSPGSELLDQDSTIIIPGVEPPSPSRRKCDPLADTLTMSHTPQHQVQTLNAWDLTPPTPTPPRHQRSEALTLDHMRRRQQENPEALTIVTDILYRTVSELSQLIVQISDTLRF